MKSTYSIKLKSRYPDVNTLFHPIDEFSGAITSDGCYTRRVLSEDNSKIEAIDFEGGPFLRIGDTIPGIESKIKSIKACYYVELEE